MDIDCPKCKARIPPDVLRPEFDCPYCHARLLEKCFAAILTVLVAWGIGAVILMSALGQVLPEPTLPTLVLKLGLTLVLGWTLHSVLFPMLRRITLKEVV